MAVKGAVFEVVDTVVCCREPCKISAKVKVKTKTGWANFCMRHYDEYHLGKSVAYCSELGLNTTEERIAWLKKRGFTGRYAQQIPSREPGADYEEDAA